MKHFFTILCCILSSAAFAQTKIGLGANLSIFSVYSIDYYYTPEIIPATFTLPIWSGNIFIEPTFGLTRFSAKDSNSKNIESYSVFGVTAAYNLLKNSPVKLALGLGINNFRYRGVFETQNSEKEYDEDDQLLVNPKLVLEYPFSKYCSVGINTGLNIMRDKEENTDDVYILTQFNSSFNFRIYFSSKD